METCNKCTEHAKATRISLNSVLESSKGNCVACKQPNFKIVLLKLKDYKTRCKTSWITTHSAMPYLYSLLQDLENNIKKTYGTQKKHNK